MINNMERDFRFLTNITSIKKFLETCYEMFTPDDLRNIIKAAEKLEIPHHSRPAVDVLFDLAGKLSIFEAERVDPEFIMDKINSFLDGN